jgi:hypothetical protein
MNCISDWRIRTNTRRNAVLPGRYQYLFILALSWFTACGAPASDSSVNDAGSKYQIEYSVRPDPEAGLVEVEMRLQQTAKLLRELRFRFDPQRISGFDGDGDISIEGSRARWNPPDDGGSLRWQVRPAHQRGNNGYDAWLDVRWGLFRAEDIIPRAATRTRKGATSETRWTFELPHDWSVVTQYSGRDGHYSINNPERRFDQPSGWMVMGRLGVRRDTIAGVRVAIAGPVDNASNAAMTDDHQRRRPNVAWRAFCATIAVHTRGQAANQRERHEHPLARTCSHRARAEGRERT